MTFYIVPVVEGQTETGCIERFLQRVWTELLAAPDRLQVLLPSRGKRDALINSDCPELAEKVNEAISKLTQRLRRDSSGRGLLLLLLDAEKDCPATLAPRLLQAAKTARGDADIVCVLAKRMFENWIAAGASSLAGVNGLPPDLKTPDRPEDRSGSKWLDDQLRKVNRGRKYKKTVDAREFVAKMNLAECRADSPSFDKLCRELEARLPPKETPPSPNATESETIPPPQS